MCECFVGVDVCCVVNGVGYVLNGNDFGVVLVEDVGGGFIYIVEVLYSDVGVFEWYFEFFYCFGVGYEYVVFGGVGVV